MKATDGTPAPIELAAFEDGSALATKLAGDVAGQLSAAIEARGSATLAVSGGSTPRRFFEELACARVEWPKVTVTLVDDRLVPPDNDRSNERLVFTHLLTGEAMRARFVPLWSDISDTPDVVAERAADAISHLPRPFDVVVLGMGTDGHTASFFPQGNNLAAATDPACEAAVLPMTAPGAGEPRLTITLPRLIEARRLVLHIEGEEKSEVLERARADGPIEEMPIRAVLRHAPAPLAVYWAS